MTQDLRNSLAMLCVAVMALVLSLATATGAEMFSDMARVVAIVLGLGGLLMLAVTLAKRG